jgi:hypothetical protein
MRYFISDLGPLALRLFPLLRVSGLEVGIWELSSMVLTATDFLYCAN